MDATEIIPGLWMGGEQVPAMPGGYGAVVDCRELSDWAVLGPPYLHLPMIDGATLPPAWMISQGAHFVFGARSAGIKTLVHCAQGHNRSGLITASYLIRYAGQTPQFAIALIRQKRGPQALSNQTFVNYLLGLAH